MMRIAVWLIIILAAAGAGIFVYRLPFSECDTPISYKIGSVDPKFGLDTQQVAADAQAAAEILDRAENRQLFVYDQQNSGLTINFVYDQRTALDNQINQLQTNLSQNSTTLDQQISAFKAQVADFENRLAAFNALVQKYNSQGGVPPGVYNSLINQQNQLKAEGEALNTKSRQLNQTTNDYNAQVGSLNQDVHMFNRAIAQKPEEGLYDSRNLTITIYFANNKNELIHTLAHEFGHAWGMEHVSDPAAIMYPFTTATVTATAQDKLELDFICREQPLPVHWVELLKKQVMKMQNAT